MSRGRLNNTPFSTTLTDTTGRLVWNRHRNVKDPVTGQICKQANASSDFVIQEVP